MPVRICPSSLNAAGTQRWSPCCGTELENETSTLALLSLVGSLAHADEPTGAELFATHCAACHGSGAEGDGPTAAVITIAVPNLRTLSMRNGGVFPADAVAAYIDGREERAAHGSREMPLWGDLLQVENAGGEPRIATLVAFIKGLQYR